MGDQLGTGTLAVIRVLMNVDDGIGSRLFLGICEGGNGRHRKWRRLEKIASGNFWHHQTLELRKMIPRMSASELKQERLFLPRLSRREVPSVLAIFCHCDMLPRLDDIRHASRSDDDCHVDASDCRPVWLETRSCRIELSTDSWTSW